jgi:hypothetical protein
MISSSKIPFGLPEQLSNPESQDFDYAALDAETRIAVKQRTCEIKSLMRRTAQDIIDIGQKLTEVKAQLGHGYFRSWLKTEFAWGIWTATKYMQVADKFKCVKFTHLDIAPSALYELAAPSTSEVARQEAIERANQGEKITYSKAKMIKAEVNARQRKRVTKPQINEPVTIDVDAETVDKESSTEGKKSEASLSWQHSAVSSVAVEDSEEELLGKETESEMFAPSEGEFDNEGSHLSLLNKQNQFSDVEPNYSSPLNMNKSLFSASDSAETVLLEHIESLSDQQVATVFETFEHNLGAETFNRLVIESIPQDDVSDLCNKCLESMDEQGFSRLAVEKINFGGLSEPALNFLNQESQRVLNERTASS